MIGRIVEVAEDGRHLQKERGFLVVKESGSSEIVGKVPLDDVAAVIASAHGLSYSNNLLVELAVRGAPFVLCGQNFLPVGVIWPVDGHHLQGKRIDAQLTASKPRQKQLWAETVKSKILQQAAVLTALNKNAIPVSALASKVRSGDPSNIEAQAAKRYWSLLFEDSFRRNRKAGGVNALLNYGYTVLRSAVARSVIAAGLHPTLGIHHRNESNPMRLVDDLMEPFRAFIDLKVFLIAQEMEEPEINKDTKRRLVMTLYDDLETPRGVSPLMECTQSLATSLAQVYLGERKSLELPLPGSPLSLAGEFKSE